VSAFGVMWLRFGKQYEVCEMYRKADRPLSVVLQNIFNLLLYMNSFGT